MSQVQEASGGGVTNTDMDRVLRVHRLNSLRVASVLRMVIAVIMIAAAVVARDNGTWSHRGVLVAGYSLVALSVLILVFSPVSRSIAADRTMFLLAMVDVVAIIGFKLLSPGGYIPLLMMVMVPRMAALDLSGPRAAMVLVFAFGAFTVSILRDPLIPQKLGWPQTSIIVVIYGFVCGTALLAVRMRLNHLDEMAEITASRQALLADAMTALEGQRREISEAIHEGPLQDVLAARRDIMDFSEKSPAEPLERAMTSLNEASRRLREATFELHPEVLEQVGLGAAVEKLARTTAERSGIAVSTDIDYPCRSAIDPMVFGVVRELLSNVVHHSEAKHASVKLTVDRATCRLDVEDDGVGMTDDTLVRRLAEGHIGLSSQRARMEAAGGTLRIVDAAVGTHICVEWPRHK